MNSRRRALVAASCALALAGAAPAARAASSAEASEAALRSLGEGRAAEPATALASARAAFLGGEYEEAERSLARLVDSGSEAAKEPLARLLIETGRPEEAALLLGEPDDAGLVCLKGEALLARGRLREAEDLFTRALALDAENRRARVFLKRIYDLTGRDDESEKIVDYFWDFNDDVLFPWSMRQEPPAGGNPYAADYVYVAEVVKGYDAAATKAAFRHFRRAYKGDLRDPPRFGGDPDLHEAYLGAGELAVEVFDWHRAQREFEALLARNPRHPGAHLGLARMYLAASKNREAESEAKKALEVNPNLVGARVVLASLHLIDDRLADARAEIDRALEADPSHPEALTADAVWNFASGDEAAFEAAVERTLAKYPRLAALHTGAASVLERRRRFPAALDEYRRAVALDPDDWEGHYGAGMTLVRMGEERAGYRELETAFDLNPFNVWAYNTLVALDKDFVEGALARRETEHFVIKITKEEEEVLGEQVDEVLEEIWKDETDRFSFLPRGPDETGRKVLFEMFADHEDFSARTAGIPNLGALGATLGQIVTMPSPSWGAGQAKPFRWTEVARHEFCHVVTLQLTDYMIPRWFTEGISVHVEGDPQIAWDELLARTVNEGEIASLEKLNSLFTRPETPQEVALGYYQATLVVGHLVEEYGFDSIKEACALYRRGRSNEEVMTAVTGLAPAELDRRIRRHIERYVERIGAWAPPGPKEMEKLDEAIARDPKDSRARARRAEGLIAASRYDEAKAEAERAIADSGGAGPARAHVVLGLVEKVRGRDEAGALAEFERAVAADPGDFFAWLYMGLALWNAGEKEKAAAALERAHATNPRFVQPVPAFGAPPLARLLLRLLTDIGERRRALAAALRAAETDPNDWESAKLAGTLLAEDGKASEASKWFARALAVNPFDAGLQLAWAGTEERRATGRAGKLHLARAARGYRAAAALAWTDVEALLGLARTSAALGRTDAAREALAKLKGIDPDNAEAAEIERSLRE
jgi:tetratricopeptide (TPR) repeat protein